MYDKISVSGEAGPETRVSLDCTRPARNEISSIILWSGFWYKVGSHLKKGPASYRSQFLHYPKIRSVKSLSVSLYSKLRSPAYWCAVFLDPSLTKGSITLTSQLSPVKPSSHEHVYPSITSDEGKHLPCPEQMFVCPHAFLTFIVK